VDAGIAHVVAGTTDPNPVVDGSGFRLLEASGVGVTVGVLEEEAVDLIVGFSKHVRTGLPFVTVKMAASLDGKTAARDGSSRWITGEEARLDVHRLRAASDAIVVGSATAVSDDPSLTVRLDGYRGRQPLRVLVDGTGKVPPTAALFGEAAPTLVATTDKAPEEIRSGWARAGAKVWMFESGPAGTGSVPMLEIVEALGREGIQTALIEGGSTLAWSAVAEGAVDRLIVYLAPKLVGGREAPGILGGPGVERITDALPVSIRSVERIGPDLKVVADVHGDR
jgi:diaminohydroxyphosphoribosylaminopyrimidine deaminase / 5-amino-6-(5-phosphoribosylamino)uracil reductase